MYKYEWDADTGGLLLLPEPEKMSLEPRPVYYRELDILGFDKYWNYEKDDAAPLMWATANNYIYRGRLVAKTKGGALYTPPALEIIEEPEKNGALLRPVDISAMTKKNAELMETLEQDTIQRIYNTYRKYKSKVDVFHVSYSGGKDSEVVLDLVKRALPHDVFIVIFGDTGMEFPDTYDAVNITEKNCERENIPFYRARSHILPNDSWKMFGSPSTTIRWCCSVHKTTPQLLLLREIVGKQAIKEMAYVGIRREESFRRSSYEYISLGTKHTGQYSCNPILEWNSAEVYLYIFRNELFLNMAYKKGNNRAGCLVCPMSGERQDYIREKCYPNEVNHFINIVKEVNEREFPTEEDKRRYFSIGGWKIRTNGRDLKGFERRYKETDLKYITVTNPMQDWREWAKTLGNVDIHNEYFSLTKDGKIYQIGIKSETNGYSVTLPDDMVRLDTTLAKNVKQIFRKAAYCIGCKECQAECPYGYITFLDGKVNINDNCIHCLSCHSPRGGCLIFTSLDLPKGNGRMNNKSIDAYADHAPKIAWIKSYFAHKDDFWDNNDLGSEMVNKFKRFLRDANLMTNNKFSKFAQKLSDIGIEKPEFWGLMLVDLSYSPEIGWYIKNVEFNVDTSREYFIFKLQNDGVKERGAKSITGAYKRIVSLPFGEMVGLGEVLVEKNKFLGIRRQKWQNPDPRVILYSLYKFAEACGDMRQFSLATLLDDEIEREGVSPTRIFGLDRDTMAPLLNGLSANYPDFISVSFTLGMDSITLRSDKKSEDVLNLF